MASPTRSAGTGDRITLCQDVVSGQASGRPYFCGEEIDRRQDFQVGAIEISPAHAIASFRSRFDTIALEDVGHGSVAYLVPEVAQRPAIRRYPQRPLSRANCKAAVPVATVT